MVMSWLKSDSCFVANRLYGFEALLYIMRFNIHSNNQSCALLVLKQFQEYNTTCIVKRRESKGVTGFENASSVVCTFC